MHFELDLHSRNCHDATRVTMLSRHSKLPITGRQPPKDLNGNNPAENPTIAVDSTRECGFRDFVVKQGDKTKFDGWPCRCVHKSCRVRSRTGTGKTTKG